MPSTFGWIDYDAKEREGMTRILALFRAKESRDELGLGPIRDAVADQLFPGTSTIHTRLRYMLFVPWIYQTLEAKGVSSSEVAQKARRMEIRLIEPLLDEQEAGVLGRRARGDLKRLPSSVYWAGLTSWGLFVPHASRDDYHAAFDRIREQRARARRRDDADLDDDPLYTWRAGIPSPPEDFPGTASFSLRRHEAEYLRDRICEAHPASLLAWFVKRDEPPPDRVDYVWEHPRYSEFPQASRELVQHAHIFAEVMAGAAVLYNLELARLRGSDDLESAYVHKLSEWTDRMCSSEFVGPLRDWSLERFWRLVLGTGYAITEPTRIFVQSWTDVARGATAGADSEQAKALVRRRERALKRAQSRFDNRRALEQWTGASGLGLATYRWPNAHVFLHDLWAGLSAATEA